MTHKNLTTYLVDNHFTKILSLLSSVFGLWSVTGCQSTEGNIGHIHSYPMTAIEAEWIRNGESIEFEDELWYPFCSMIDANSRYPSSLNEVQNFFMTIFKDLQESNA